MAGRSSIGRRGGPTSLDNDHLTVGARWRQTLRPTVLLRRELLLLQIALLASCSSVSTSNTHTYVLATVELQVAARAERGLTADRLFIVVNGRDVAEGPFGSDEAAGTVLRGTFDEMPVEARCGHRWRPGIHVGYRCFIQVGAGEPIQVDF